MGDPNTLLKEELKRLIELNARLTRENDELREKSDLYHQAVNNSPNPIFSVDTEGVIQTYNSACIAMFLDGRSMVGRHFSLLLADQEQLSYVGTKLAEMKGDASLTNIDLSYRCHGGAIREMMSRVYPLSRQTGEIYGYVFANTDVTERNVILRELESYRNDLEQMVSERTASLRKEIKERRLAEEALKISHDSLAAILDNIEAEIWVTDPEQKELIFINRQLKSRFGRRSDQDITIKDIVKRNLIWEEGDRPEDDEWSGTAHDSELDRWYLINEHRIRWVDSRMVQLKVATDITARRRFDQELQRVEKLESLGVFAGGIAHDFNNLLVGILGNASLVKCCLPAASTNYSLLANIEKAGFRAKDLAQQLLTFSKGGEPIRKPTALDSLLFDTVEFATRGSNLEAKYDLSKGLNYADVDPGQISQVFHNIVINAVQAMPEGGNIEVIASNTSIESQAVIPVPPGDYLKVIIQDNGPGISAVNLVKVFDPYFTTKKNGSGLGLATAHTIIKRHRGHITVSSESGKGTVFTLLLPATEAVGAEESTMSQPAKLLSTATGRVLVMDDEELVREVAEATLEHLGFEVSTAREGGEAIRIYESGRSDGAPFDAVILDLTIRGGMGGMETISQLRKLDPGVRAIVCSGYSNDPVMANYKEAGFDGVITKPYRIDEVASALKKLLA